MIAILLLWMLQGVQDTPVLTQPATAIYSTSDTILWEEPKWIPIIEPAIQVVMDSQVDRWCYNGSGALNPCGTLVWTCADKSRILLTSEDQQRYCLTMKVFEGTR